MSGLDVKKFSIPKDMLDSMHEGKSPSASDLYDAISASEPDGDSDE